MTSAQASSSGVTGCGAAWFSPAEATSISRRPDLS